MLSKNFDTNCFPLQMWHAALLNVHSQQLPLYRCVSYDKAQMHHEASVWLLHGSLAGRNTYVLMSL